MLMTSLISFIIKKSKKLMTSFIRLYNYTEIIFHKKGFSQDIAPVSNIPQCPELSILGVTLGVKLSIQ